jgi:hypothetical protein
MFCNSYWYFHAILIIIHCFSTTLDHVNTRLTRIIITHKLFVPLPFYNIQWKLQVLRYRSKSYKELFKLKSVILQYYQLHTSTNNIENGCFCKTSQRSVSIRVFSRSFDIICNKLQCSIVINQCKIKTNND